mmetsp:Transcript_56604/g.176020  ORF Transcript_56604/g.176020 Transcript_56604/m.176020 type:complete len:289 (+) Transcript_56604:855-1721(+)
MRGHVLELPHPQALHGSVHWPERLLERLGGPCEVEGLLPAACQQAQASAQILGCGMRGPLGHALDSLPRVVESGLYDVFEPLHGRVLEVLYHGLLVDAHDAGAVQPLLDIDQQHDAKDSSRTDQDGLPSEPRPAREDPQVPRAQVPVHHGLLLSLPLRNPRGVGGVVVLRAIYVELERAGLGAGLLKRRGSGCRTVVWRGVLRGREGLLRQDLKGLVDHCHAGRHAREELEVAEEKEELHQGVRDQAPSEGLREELATPAEVPEKRHDQDEDEAEEEEPDEAEALDAQ